MRIEIQEYNDISVIELQGEFTGDFVKPLNDTITDVVTAGKTGIVLDLTNVSYIDSQGLEQLLVLKEYCSEKKRQLKLAGLDENCMKILEITRLQSQFDSYSEVAEAVKSFV